MRILTWNIHGARDAALRRIAREIAASEPDVVCLNELRRRHGKPLGRMLGFRAYIASSFIGPYGNAILTNDPVTGWRRLRFSGTRRVDRRDAAIVTLAAGPAIAAIHLNALRPDERTRNAAELLESLPESSIIAGDLNEKPDGSVAGLFSHRLDDGCASAGPTFPAATPRARIDYIWLPRGARASGCRVVPTSSSDHLPVIVDVTGV